MKYLFNSKDLGFYPGSLKDDYVKAGTWPDHGVEVDQETRDKFTQSVPTGKMLGADKNGNPCWVDIPPPPHDELVKQAEAKKKALMDKAKQEIIFLGLMGDDSDKLNLWKDYYNNLNGINVQNAPDIEWPIEPEN